VTFLEPRDLIDQVYEHCEAGDIDKAVLACIRLARKISDTFNAVMFFFELYPNRDQHHRAFNEETKHLTKEARQRLWKETLERFLQERTFEGLDDDEDKLPPGDRKNVVVLSVGVLQKEPERLEQRIADLQVPHGMGPFDTAAFTDRNNQLKYLIRRQLTGFSAVLDRIRTRCFEYASRVERQLDAQSKTESLLGRIQNNVNNYFAARCDPVYQKLIKASSLIDSSNPEDHSLVLTTIRRAVKATADHFYPPKDGVVIDEDGNQHGLGNEQYLNRLEEFSKSFGSGTAADLLRAELSALMVLIRKVDKIGSKGVHSDVTRTDAEQGLLGLYLFLANLIAKLDLRPTAGDQVVIEALIT